ncbi:MAG TPA: hypothetical protein PL063_01555 [Candidatus Cloacimonadota bacterium]|nr:hypothetical protein [Candidatus Cloacimonadota bacterium]HQB41496.1 hypothetical protein [Candidatus Cloacimonadota bacterium]
MIYILALVLILLVVDTAFNQGALLHDLFFLEEQGMTIVKISALLIVLIIVILLVYAIIMEWNLLPKIKPTKTLFEMANDHEERKEKKNLNGKH